MGCRRGVAAWIAVLYFHIHTWYICKHPVLQNIYPRLFGRGGINPERKMLRPVADIYISWGTYLHGMYLGNCQIRTLDIVMNQRAVCRIGIIHHPDTCGITQPYARHVTGIWKPDGCSIGTRKAYDLAFLISPVDKQGFVIGNICGTRHSPDVISKPYCSSFRSCSISPSLDDLAVIQVYP